MTQVPAAVAEAERTQRLAADPARNVFVSANAGSGKTRVLVDRVIRLLLEGSTPDRILCLTYTKASASEMQTRLFDRLGAWSVKSDGELEAQLAALDPCLAAASAAQLRRARALFARALETPGGLKIQTIHAFCERLLRRFPLEAGVDPGFEILDDAAAREIAGVARRELASRDGLPAAFATLAASVSDMDSDRFLSWASSKRLEIERGVRGAGGVDAATARLRDRLGAPEGATPEDVKAAAWRDGPIAEIRAAVAELARGSTTEVRFADALAAAFSEAEPAAVFDAYAAALHTADGKKLREDFVTKGSADVAPVAVRLFGGKKLGGHGSEVSRVLRAIESVRAVEVAALTEAALRIATAYLDAYENEKRRRGGLDFADLIDRARILVESSEASEWVLYKLDGGVDHVLVDEAQDTAPDQWELIERLSQEFFTGLGARETVRTVFAVGDEKQSIYSFQGADPARFLEASRRLDKRAADADRVFTSPNLSVSFRCAPLILQTVDAVFASPELQTAMMPLREPPGVDVVRHAASRDDFPGFVEWWPLAVAIDSDEPESYWDPVDAPSKGDAKEILAAAVAARVRSWLDAGATVFHNKTPRAMTAGDVIVLVRSRGALFENLIRKLKAAGVPVAGADRMTLTNQLAVEDVLGLARVALTPGDDLALAELLKSPFLHPAASARPPIDEDALFSLAHGRAPGERLRARLAASQDPVFAEARALVDALDAAAEASGPYAFFLEFLERASPTGESYLKRLYARLGAEAEDPVENLIARALDFETRHGPSLLKFVHVTTAEEAEIKRDMGEAGDEVRVMTVHGAKGLEAPVVIVPDVGSRTAGRGGSDPFLVPGAGFLWSPSKSRDPDAAAELRDQRAALDTAEHLRLLYVALTRAKDRLVVCGAGGRGVDKDALAWHRLVADGMRRAGARPSPAPVGGDDEALILGDEPPPLGSRPAAARVDPTLPDWTRSPAPPPSRARRVVSPSSGLGGARSRAPVPSPIADDGATRFRRGILVHKLLEILPELPAADREGAARRFLKRHVDLSDPQRKALWRETRGILEHPEFGPLFGPAGRPEAAVMGSAPELPDDVVVNGRIDRLLVTDDEVLAVDFKTNRPPPDRVDDVNPEYLVQLAAYQAVLRRAYAPRIVKCALLWTDTAVLMPIPDLLLKRALAAA